MDIAFFGSSLVSSYWNGAATYYRGILKALSALGHSITFYEPDAYDRQKHRDIDDPPWASVFIYSAEGFDGVHQALEHAGAADLIVKASGVGVLDEVLERSVLEIKRPGTLAVFWDVDAPATLERVQHDPSDPFADMIPQYDFILTYGGGQPVVSAYERLGARLCVPIYNALDPTEHYPVPPDPRFEADLSFLGNRLPDREARIDRFFFDAARRLPERRFLLGGNGWQDKPMPENVRCAGHVYTADHNAFNCSARAVLNVCRESMARYGYSPATRLFEAAGAAACIVTDAWLGLGQFLEPNREILVAQNGEEVAEILASLKPKRAREIGSKAQARVLAEHTYTHRAWEVDAFLTGRKSRIAGSTAAARI